MAREHKTSQIALRFEDQAFASVVASRLLLINKPLSVPMASFQCVD